MIARYEQAPADQRTYLSRDAIALVAHDDDAVRSQLLRIEILAVEQRAIDRQIGGAQQVRQFHITDRHTRNAPHRGLHHLRVPSIDRIPRAVDDLDAKPVGYTDDGAKVPRVLHPVEREAKATRCRDMLLHRQLEDGQHLLWMLQEAQSLKLVGTDRSRVCRQRATILRRREE